MMLPPDNTPCLFDEAGVSEEIDPITAAIACKYVLGLSIAEDDAGSPVAKPAESPQEPTCADSSQVPEAPALEADIIAEETGNQGAAEQETGSDPGAQTPDETSEEGPVSDDPAANSDNGKRRKG